MMLAPIATLLASFVLPSIACQPSSGFKMTFYGWPDNSPPGNKVSINCGGRNGAAAGNGTHANPLTMAAEAGRFTDCEIVYSPYLKKYLRMEDTCANCNGDWVDIWTGSTTGDGGSELKKCQNSLTGSNSASHSIITAPPDNLEVNDLELFDNGQCLMTNVYATNDANGSCSGGSAPSVPPVDTSSPSAAPAPRPTGRRRKGNGRYRHKHDRRAI